MDDNDIDVNLILETFDALLPIYIEVESSNQTQIEEIIAGVDHANFQFSTNARRLPNNRSYTSVERETNIDIRHSMIQQALYNKLVAIFGNENVSLENPFNGNKIDVVLKEGEHFTFYEVKTGNSAKSCIRQAIGQLLEYGYFPGILNADRIVVVGEPGIDSQTDTYIQYLRQHFSIPIYYEKVKL